MGTSKTEKFTKEQNEIASIAKTLGHPARIAILQHLVKVNSCICGDIVDEIGLSQSTISQHLKELKREGIIKGEVEGRKVCYCINTERLDIVSTIFNGMFKRFSCC
ncbi:ArsR/SmtB family transcription factor [Portibacter lacus]|uniref:Transcriptional regulator n=1 Tax=Portibacter lacus TaxID=1099794 RepID=A0AA37WCV4_9BACT|nr:metalloregulator ArsR/SmtB family transcription factor [Portibacter lacus]GLR16961.1 transcriptional regulator [Portibacter lacus]